MQQGTDTHGGIVKGGWESPLHVQSTQEWELFSEVPILAFKLSTLCRQLEGTRRKARPFFAVFLCLFIIVGKLNL